MGKPTLQDADISYNTNMKVILIGYRGSGKSSVGRLLAPRLGGGFADVDDQIMARFGGKSVAEIWGEFGEPAYRQVEVEVTQGLLNSDFRVIGLGGGTLMQPKARQAVEQLHNACRVYLHAPVEVLFRRIQSDPTSTANRPSLTVHGGGLEEIRTVLAVRDPVYRAVADQVVEVAGQTLEQIADRIERFVRKKNRTRPDE